MKILITSDLHIHPHKQSMKRLQDCLDVLRWALETAKSLGINHVLFLGDLFHDRQKIQVFAYQKAFEILRDFPSLDINLLLGNHDLWYYERWDVSSVAPLGAMRHVRVIDRPSTITVAGLPIDFLPFTHNPVAVLSDHFPKKSPVLCGHIAVDGAVLNKVYGTRAEVAVEHDADMVRVGVDLFSGWKRVFLGHYHGEQRLNHVEYVGSPLQLSFNEAHQTKHLVILDAETLETEYVENTFSPRHLIINAADISKHDLKDNFVDVCVDTADTVDIVDFRNEVLAKHKPASLEFREKKKLVEEVRPEIFEKFDLASGDVLDRYLAVEEVGHLDKGRLLKIGRDICTVS